LPPEIDEESDNNSETDQLLNRLGMSRKPIDWEHENRNEDEHQEDEWNAPQEEKYGSQPSGHHRLRN
jgi:hypothetical protein